ncbi:MAG TPA: hypothetical protein VN670_01655 [Acidobacteriaceae bacterium]|nr:hypothetical protein [Acidobacteriaceae bacterium]
MKSSRIFSTLALAAVIASGLVFAQATKLTGVVSDQMCGAKHMTDDAAKCTRECVKMGSPYALVVGNKVYTLKGHASELDALAGQSAVITGTVSGTTVDVASVAAAK